MTEDVSIVSSKGKAPFGGKRKPLKIKGFSLFKNLAKQENFEQKNVIFFKTDFEQEKGLCPRLSTSPTSPLKRA